MKKSIFFCFLIAVVLTGMIQSTVFASSDGAAGTATQTATTQPTNAVWNVLTPTPVVGEPGSNTVTASLDTNCRKNPIRSSHATAYLKADQSAVVIGKERSGHWYLIYDPSGEKGKSCWVWSGSTTYNGDLEKLGIVSSDYNSPASTPVADNKR